MAKRLDSVESGCWNVEILEEKEAMVEVDWIPFLRKCFLEIGMDLGGGTLWDFYSCTRNKRLETDE